MKNKLKLAVCAVLIAVIALAGYDQFFAGNKDPKISYVHADYVIDMDDPTQVIGLGDYVFVAKVNEFCVQNIEMIHHILCIQSQLLII